MIAGGGSPCQPNTSLNMGRRGLHDERALQPFELVRIIADIRDLPEVKEQRLPVLGWLENTASSPPEVVSAYSEALHAIPLEMDAADYGWTGRRRLFWIEQFEK